MLSSTLSLRSLIRNNAAIDVNWKWNNFQIATRPTGITSPWDVTRTFSVASLATALILWRMASSVLEWTFILRLEKLFNVIARKVSIGSACSTGEEGHPTRSFQNPGRMPRLFKRGKAFDGITTLLRLCALQNGWKLSPWARHNKSNWMPYRLDLAYFLDVCIQEINVIWAVDPERCISCVHSRCVWLESSSAETQSLYNTTNLPLSYLQMHSTLEVFMASMICLQALRDYIKRSILNER